MKIDSLIKVVKNIGYQLENLKVKEPPLKRRKISNDSSSVDIAASVAGSVQPLQNTSNDRLQQKPKSKPKAPIGNNSSHPPNKSPVNRSQQPPQKQQASAEKEIPREFAMFLKPNAKEQKMNDDEMSKLSFVISKLPGQCIFSNVAYNPYGFNFYNYSNDFDILFELIITENNLSFLMGLLHYSEPVEDPSKEYTLDVEKLKLSTLRALERYAIYCVGSEKYSHITERKYYLLLSIKMFLEDEVIYRLNLLSFRFSVQPFCKVFNRSSVYCFQLKMIFHLQCNCCLMVQIV